ncbi:MAG TPA: aldolase catalytic domain-containing protein [Candidatus Omnitrophota bacterium]|nr:aldolase catalytic domain-containing protein [Candidatus Omnitrophota bacterium]
MTTKIQIIDCTIRDGGHLNKWQFEDNLVKASYFAAQKGQVDYFEIGYKNDPGKKGLGPFGYCDEKYINGLFKSSSDCKLLFMLDAGKYSGYKIPDRTKEPTPFTGVRVAAYPFEVKIAVDLAEQFHEAGYEVFMNLMASSEWSQQEFAVLKNWKQKNALKAVYFADSFGAYAPAEISELIGQLKALGFERIGFHAHNNLQMAFANTLHAITEGASYVDASIYGMGRGAGNLPIEILLSYLSKIGDKEYNVVPYLDVIERFFLPLFEKDPWGYSLRSLLGGIRNIHPYYIDELFNSHNYTIEEICNIAETVKEKCPISFSGEKLKNALEERFYVPTTSQAKEAIRSIEKELKAIPSKDAFSLDSLGMKDRHKGKKFLIIGNGPSIVKHEDKIKGLIKRLGLVTIGCNFLNSVYAPDYHIFVSKKRFLKYAATVSKKSILLVPSFFGKRLVQENYSGPVEYVQIDSIDDLNSSPIDGIRQQVKYLNVGVNAILTALQMGAQEIMAVGMDGYESEEQGKVVYFYNEKDVPDDKAAASLRYENMDIELKRVSDFLNDLGIPFSIITPTSHKKYFNNSILV